MNLIIPFNVPLERGMAYWGVFMTAEYVGLLRSADPDSNDELDTDIIQILAYNRETKYECIISTDISADVSLTAFPEPPSRTDIFPRYNMKVDLVPRILPTTYTSFVPVLMRAPLPAFRGTISLQTTTRTARRK